MNQELLKGYIEMAKGQSKLLESMSGHGESKDRINNKDVKLEMFTPGSVGKRALQFSTWEKSSGARFANISDESGQFWKQAVSNVRAKYEEYVVSKPLQRLNMVPDIDYSSKWSRIRPIAGTLIRDAIPVAIKDKLVLEGRMEFEHA